MCLLVGLITSPAGAVAKYCDDVCLSVYVCLSMRISPEPHVRSSPIFVHVPYVRSVLLRQVDDRSHRQSAGRGDGSAQRGRSVIYDCLVVLLCHLLTLMKLLHKVHRLVVRQYFESLCYLHSVLHTRREIKQNHCHSIFLWYTS